MTHKNLVFRLVLPVLILSLGAPSCFEEKPFRKQSEPQEEPLKSKVPEPEFQKFEEPIRPLEKEEGEVEITQETPEFLRQNGVWKEWVTFPSTTSRIPIASYLIKSRLSKSVHITPSLHGIPAIFFDEFILEQSYIKSSETEIKDVTCKKKQVKDDASLVQAFSLDSVYFSLYNEAGKNLKLTENFELLPGESVYLVWFILAPKFAHEYSPKSGWDIWNFTDDEYYKVSVGDQSAYIAPNTHYNYVFNLDGSLFCSDKYVSQFPGFFRPMDIIQSHSSNYDFEGKFYFKARLTTGLTVFLQSPSALSSFPKTEKYFSNLNFESIKNQRYYSEESYGQIKKKNDGYFGVKIEGKTEESYEYVRLPMEEDLSIPLQTYSFVEGK